MEKVVYKPFGDSAVLIVFGDSINQNVLQRVLFLKRKIEQASLPFVYEVTSAYTSLTVFYNAFEVGYDEMVAALKILEGKEVEKEKLTSKLVKVPVCYEKPFAPDMEEVASYNGLSAQDVIDIHSQPIYLVYMLGFTPGFMYLGGMDEKIACPRKQNPRPKIQAGSVGIADKQTGIYSVDSPGGWQLIGKTPLTVFDFHRENRTLAKAGDYIQFVPVSTEEYEQIKSENKKISI